MKKAALLLLLSFISPVSVFADEYDDAVRSAMDLIKSDPAGAKKSIAEVIRKNPDKGAGYIVSGIIRYQADGDAALASADFMKGISLVPASEERKGYVDLVGRVTCRFKTDEEFSLYKEGFNAIEQGEPAKAIDPLKRAVALNPANWRLFYELGFASIDTGENDAALLYLEKARAINPFGKMIMSELVYLYSQLGDLPNLRKTVDAQILYNGDEPALHQELAFAYADAGKKDLAVSELEGNIRTYPSYAHSYYFLGRLYYNDGNMEKAGPLLKSFVEKTEGSEALKENKSLAEALEKAKEMLAPVASPAEKKPETPVQ